LGSICNIGNKTGPCLKNKGEHFPGVHEALVSSQHCKKSKNNKTHIAPSSPSIYSITYLCQCKLTSIIILVFGL
jgi:predicted secreted Zn-dependent protease